MDHHSDEKWKFSKKGGSRSRREPPTSTSIYTSTSSASASSSSSSSSTASSTGGPYLKRSSSMPENVKLNRRPPIAGSPPASPRSFSRKCANMAKEQRAKFYIVRRCVTMLMCWRDYP